MKLNAIKKAHAEGARAKQNKSKKMNISERKVINWVGRSEGRGRRCGLCGLLVFALVLVGEILGVSVLRRIHPGRYPVFHPVNQGATSVFWVLVRFFSGVAE